MELKINGKPEKITGVNNIRDLVAKKGLAGQNLLIEHNGRIIKTWAWSRINLQDGDSVEIFKLVGGG